jgi:hypothetical protein
MPSGKEQQASAEDDAASDASSISSYDSDDAKLREVRGLHRCWVQVADVFTAGRGVTAAME